MGRAGITVIAVFLGFVMLLPSATTVFASSKSPQQRYNDGFNDGYQAALSDRQSGNQYNYACDPQGLHTSDGQHTIFYCNGWAAGYRSGWYSGGGVIRPQPVPRPSGINWMNICRSVSFALLQSCDALVGPNDFTLTPAGNHAYACIRSGAILAGIALANGIPADQIVGPLSIAAQLFGCGDVLNFNILSVSQLHNLGQIFHAVRY